MSMELGEEERLRVEQTVRQQMLELRKVGNLKVRFIPYLDPVAKREDIIRVTVSIAQAEFKTWIRLEDVQFDWPRMQEALRIFVAALPA